VLVVETDLETARSVVDSVCPECGTDLNLFRLNATQTYLEEHPGTEAPVIGVWDGDKEERAIEAGEVAEFNYRCPKCHQSYTAYLLTSGDWEVVVDK